MNSEEIDKAEHHVSVRFLGIFLITLGLIVTAFFKSWAVSAIFFSLFTIFFYVIKEKRIALNRSNFNVPNIRQNIYIGWKAVMYGYLFLGISLVIFILIYTNLAEIFDGQATIFTLNIDSYPNLFIGVILGIVLGTWYHRLTLIEHDVLVDKYGSKIIK